MKVAAQKSWFQSPNQKEVPFMRAARPLVLSLVITVSLATPSFAQNLVANPDFDIDVSEWSNPYIDRIDWIPDDGNPAGSGPGCMEIADTQNNGGCTGAIQMDIAVAPHTTYVISGTARLPAGSVAAYASIWVDWLDAGGSFIDLTRIFDVTRTVDGPWTAGSWRVTSPAGAATAWVRPGLCMPSGGTGESSARWDDLFLAPLGPEIFSDGFESGSTSRWTP
jgi:hypothetical protein